MENVKPTKLQLSSVFPVGEDDHHNSRSSSADKSGSDMLNRKPEEEKLDLEVEDDTSSENDDDEEISDTESCTSCVSPKRFEFFSANGLVELEEGDRDYSMIKEKFFSGLGALGNHTSIVAVQKNLFLGPLGQARMESFQIYSNAMARKRGEGHANIKCAWYGGSKDRISGIISHGFGMYEKPDNSELYGFGIYLSPQNSSFERIMASPIDENGLRHVLLCRVIFGNLEQVRRGSEQFHPSSEEFDSGVDNLFFPKKYIVWSTNMNTHILPEYVISFRAPISLEGFQRAPGAVMRPNSAWMPFGTLIMVLSRCLPPAKISVLKKHHAAFRQRKITRPHLIQIVRNTVGDNLLVSVIKSFRAQGSEASTSGS